MFCRSPSKVYHSIIKKNPSYVSTILNNIHTECKKEEINVLITLHANVKLICNI